jgi:hypothetical protein
MKNFSLSAICLATAALFSGSALADGYQSFTNASYTNVDVAGSNNDIFAIESIYYLQEKAVLGPLDQLTYLNTTTNIYGHYLNADSNDAFSVGGEYFIDKFLVGASYTDTDFDDAYSVSLGYVVNKNFIVKATLLDSDNGDKNYFFSGSYNVELEGKDYLGFTFTTDDEFDNHQISAKYFKALTNGRYITSEVSYAINDNADNFVTAVGSYYMNTNTSVFVGFDSDNDDYSVGAKHYFTKNYALSGSYTTGDNDLDLYSINFTAQF